MQQSLGPGIALLRGRGELIDRAASRHGRAVCSSALLGGSVKIALLIEHHAARRISPVSAALETVEDFLFPFGRSARSQQHSKHDQRREASCQAEVVSGTHRQSSAKPSKAGAATASGDSTSDLQLASTQKTDVWMTLRTATGMDEPRLASTEQTRTWGTKSSNVLPCLAKAARHGAPRFRRSVIPSVILSVISRG